jgi:hypothetical protein
MILAAVVVAVMAAAARPMPVSMKPAAYCQPSLSVVHAATNNPSNAAIMGRKIRASSREARRPTRKKPAT